MNSNVTTVLIVLLALLSRTPGGFSQQTVMVADAACASCHHEIYQAYLASPMANASGPAADRLVAQSFTHRPSGMQYQVLQDQSGVWLAFRNQSDPRIAGRHRLDYYLGSGHLGVTYLYLQEGYLLESPVAWYAATGSYDMKPGFGQLTEMPPALPSEPACLRCHMSAVQHVEPGSLNRYRGLPFLQTGITCESCHGDTSAHLQSGGKAAVINPARLDAGRRDSVCLSCHLEGDVTVERAGRSALDYRPGQSISDYLSFFVFAGKDQLSRGVSEVEQFSASHCKQASGDRMSCTSCHDPHRAPSTAERAGFYRSKCVACHSAPTFVRSHHPDTPDCTRCHMPRSTANNIPHVAWTDHRILRQPQSAAIRLQAPAAGEPLVAVFSPRADQRDAAVAAYQAVMRGKSHDSQGALNNLMRVYAEGERDAKVLEGLAVLTGLSGQGAESEKYLRELLTVAPLDLTGLSDLGVLLAKKGDLQAAIATWRPAFARNQDIFGLARNLVAAQCLAGDATAAKKTMSDALRFSPGVRQGLNFRCGN